MKRNLAFGLCLALGACGTGVEKGDYKPILGTLNGRITAATSVVIPDAPIRVALLWTSNPSQTQSLTGFPAVIAQELGVSSSFPTEFQINLTEPPPAGAVLNLQFLDGDTTDWPGVDLSMQYAQGTLVAYADTNGNGKFDITDSLSEPSPDVVLGAATDYTIFYLVSGQPAVATLYPTQYVGIFPTATGLSVASATEVVDPDPDDCSFVDSNNAVNLIPCGGVFGGLSTVLPAGASVPIALSNDPTLQKYACDTYPGPGDWPDLYASATNLCDSSDYVAGCDCSGTGCPLELPPAGVKVTCSSDNTQYVWKTCKEVDAFCGAEICHFGSGAYVPGQTPPANWPCPSDS